MADIMSLVPAGGCEEYGEQYEDNNPNLYYNFGNAQVEWTYDSAVCQSLIYLSVLFFIKKESLIVFTFFCSLLKNRTTAYEPFSGLFTPYHNKQGYGY